MIEPEKDSVILEMARVLRMVDERGVRAGVAEFCCTSLPFLNPEFFSSLASRVLWMYKTVNELEHERKQSQDMRTMTGKQSEAQQKRSNQKIVDLEKMLQSQTNAWDIEKVSFDKTNKFYKEVILERIAGWPNWAKYGRYDG